MNIIAKFNALSGREKVVLLGVVGLAGYVIYDQFAPKLAHAAPSAPSLPTTPAPVPIASGAPTVMYRVATETDPLFVRTGPGQNYPDIGSNPKGSTVRGTTEIKKGLVEGSMGDWVAVLHADGSAWGWSAKKYLQPA